MGVGAQGVHLGVGLGVGFRADPGAGAFRACCIDGKQGVFDSNMELYITTSILMSNLPPFNHPLSPSSASLPSILTPTHPPTRAHRYGDKKSRVFFERKTHHECCTYSHLIASEIVLVISHERYPNDKSPILLRKV